MKITTLVENEKSCALANVHGLSLHIATEKQNILFDFGPDDTFLKNAELIGIDISKVDVAILSHGHADHGGGLEKFLEVNTHAKVYVQETAFDFICSNSSGEIRFIGLNEKLKYHPQVVLISGNYKISDDLELFVVDDISKCYSSANDTLFAYGKADLFKHEQQFILRDGGNTTLFVGCGHCGIVNILEKAKAKGYNENICVGGYHLYSGTTKKTVSKSLLNEISNSLKEYHNIKFYTCHCTGKEAFKFLQERVSEMHYLKCGETIII